MTLPLIVLNGWVLLLLFDYFHAIITMVVVATLLAFVLEYPVAWLQRFRLRRPRAVLLVLLLFGLVLLVLGITLVPVIIEQVNELGDRLPGWIASGTQQLDTLGLKVLAIAVVIDQLIENGVAPQLIGGFTGLSPVWVLISLLIGAKVAGLLGVVVAVPIAGSIRYLLAKPEPQPVPPGPNSLDQNTTYNPQP